MDPSASGLRSRTQRGLAGRTANRRALAAALLCVTAASACRLTSAATPDPTLAALSGQVADQATRISHLATQVGAIARPTTASADEPGADVSLTGSVVLEEGRCCVMGLVGADVEIHAAFEARSPFADVTEMRFLAGASPAGPQELDEVAWEPFQPSDVFLAEAALNWLGFYVSVQYRDSLGRTSPVFVDDVSIEGFIPAPTPT